MKAPYDNTCRLCDWTIPFLPLTPITSSAPCRLVPQTRVINVGGVLLDSSFWITTDEEFTGPVTTWDAFGGSLSADLSSSGIIECPVGSNDRYGILEAQRIDPGTASAYWRYLVVSLPSF